MTLDRLRQVFARWQQLFKQRVLERGLVGEKVRLAHESGTTFDCTVRCIGAAVCRGAWERITIAQVLTLVTSSIGVGALHGLERHDRRVSLAGRAAGLRSCGPPPHPRRGGTPFAFCTVYRVRTARLYGRPGRFTAHTGVRPGQWGAVDGIACEICASTEDETSPKQFG